MAREYRWRKADEWSVDLALKRVMEVARNKVQAGDGPFVLTQDSDRIASNRSRLEVIERLKTVLVQREIGSIFRVRAFNDNVVFTARAVQALADIDSTNGNAHADQFFNWIKMEFGKYNPRFAGAYVCKRVSGSLTMSQHSYGNADDFFFDTIAHQHAVYVEIKHGNCPVPINLTICERHDWSPTQGETSYGGDYHGHLHTQFAPIYSGACGVRG